MTPCRPQSKPFPDLRVPRPGCVATQLACVRCCSSRSPTWPPGAAIAASIPAGAALAGGSLPLAVVFALVACLLCAWCIGLLARELPAAGSLATYAARGLHPAAGFLVAWGYVLVGWLIPPLVLLQLGFTTAATINSEFHGYPANLWWPWSLAGAVIVLAAGYFGVRASTRFGTILGISEIAVFLVLPCSSWCTRAAITPRKSSPRTIPPPG